MRDWRRGYMVIGTMLCISGALADQDPLLVLGTVSVASAGLQAIVIGSAQAEEPGVAGDPNALAPGIGEPLELAPRASKRPMVTFGSVPDVAYAPHSSTGKQIANDPESTLVPMSTLAIQQALLRLGYDPGPADGRMGPKTHAAIEAYEELMGWTPLGAVDLRLTNSLIAGLAGVETFDLQFEKDLCRSAAREATYPLIAAEPMPNVVDTVFERSAVSILRADNTPTLVLATDNEHSIGALETAIVAVFNAARDTTLYLVRFFHSSEPRDITPMASHLPNHDGIGVQRAGK